MTLDRRPINLLDFEALARERLDPGIYEFIAGGAEDEQTVADNRLAFARVRLRPRVLIDVSSIDTSINLLGTRLRLPVVLAPTALHALAHPDGELATARAAATAGTIFIVSTNASIALETVAKESSAPLWFQLYVHRDRAFTADLMHRAEASGYRALMLTVDTPRLGRRERDLRRRFALPPHITTPNLHALGQGVSNSAADRESYHHEVANQFDPSLTWDIIGWLRGQTRLPILIKGILSPDDAVRAVDAGAAGIVVSNHGGRQLDGVLASLDALPEIVAQLNGRVPILLDGGVRRGTDIVKALALGATAVCIGRPYLWALAAGGDEGVRQAIDMLHAELELAMTLCGCPTIDSINESCLARSRTSSDRHLLLP